MTQVKLEFTDSRPNAVALAEQARAMLEQVVNTPAFAQKVRTGNYSFQERVTKNDKRDHPDRARIFDIIANGEEGDDDNDAPGDAGTINLSIALKNFANSFDARTDILGSTIEIDTTFFDGCLADNDSRRLAALFMHEWLHCAGFFHKGSGLHDVCNEVESFVNAVARDMHPTGFIDNVANVFAAVAPRSFAGPRRRLKCPVTVDDRERTRRHRRHGLVH